MGVNWETMKNTGAGGAHAWILRAKVPGGWLVAAGDLSTLALAFIPDPRHLWDETPERNEAAEDYELMRQFADAVLASEPLAAIRERLRGGESSVGG